MYMYHVLKRLFKMETNCKTEIEDNKTIKGLIPKEILNQNNTMRNEKGDVNSKSKKLKIIHGTPSGTGNPTLEDRCKKITPEDLKILCDGLSSFNEGIQKSSGVLKMRYDLPRYMLERLEGEALELDGLYKELVRTSKHVETIRNQREAVAKERLDLDSQVTRLKADVLNELEVIVSVYDVGMLERWHEIKNTESQAQVENFLHDVKGKLEAMKNLQTLATQKLAKMADVKEENLKKDKKRKNKEESRRQPSSNVYYYNERQSQRGQRMKNQERQKKRMRTEGFGTRWDSETQLAPLPLPLLDSESEGLLEDPAVNNVLYNLVYGEILNLPAWVDTFDTVSVD